MWRLWPMSQLPSVTSHFSHITSTALLLCEMYLGPRKCTYQKKRLPLLIDETNNDLSPSPANRGVRAVSQRVRSLFSSPFLRGRGLRLRGHQNGSAPLTKPISISNEMRNGVGCAQLPAAGLSVTPHSSHSIVQPLETFWWLLPVGIHGVQHRPLLTCHHPREKSSQFGVYCMPRCIPTRHDPATQRDGAAERTSRACSSPPYSARVWCLYPYPVECIVKRNDDISQRTDPHTCIQ